MADYERGSYVRFETLDKSIQVFVPVQARGRTIVDNGGDPIIECVTGLIAEHVAALINKDAGFAPRS